MWIARDKDGALLLFKHKPIREKLYDGTVYWQSDIIDNVVEIDGSLSDITWEDEPREVGLKIE